MRPRPSFHAAGVVGYALWPALTLLGACITDPGEFLAVQLSVSDVIVRPSEPIDIEVRVTNHGNAEAKIEGFVGCVPPFSITDGSGVKVGPGQSRICSAALVITPLAPGASNAFATQWAGEDIAGDTLPFADYEIEGWVTPEGRNPIYTGGVVVRFEADTIPTP